MSNPNYPLVTMTMEQYEKMKSTMEKVQELNKHIEVTDKVLSLVLKYFNTEEEKEDFMNYIVSNTDENKPTEKKLRELIENRVNQDNEITKLAEKLFPNGLNLTNTKLTIDPSVQMPIQNHLNHLQNILNK